MRGRLVTLNQLTIVVGILPAQVVNWLIASPVPEGAPHEIIRVSWNGQYGWRWMFTVAALPAFLSFWGVVRSRESALAGEGGHCRRRAASLLASAETPTRTIRSSRFSMLSEPSAKLGSCGMNCCLPDS